MLDVEINEIGSEISKKLGSVVSEQRCKNGGDMDE
jgi:hypothetical protein